MLAAVVAVLASVTAVLILCSNCSIVITATFPALKSSRVGVIIISCQPSAGNFSTIEFAYVTLNSKRIFPFPNTSSFEREKETVLSGLIVVVFSNKTI
ncbi:hypothetical protein ABE25_17970 [Cytobacillus firmus]|nr:hypothetical protein [Cytobacillus firmus]MBG9656054.1 hypothetical protein [Cytobacillus firmus]